MQEINYKKGIPTLLLCFFIWGFQPLYWYICGEWDTYFLLACRIIWAAVCCLCILWAQGKLPQLLAVFRDKNILKREIPASVFLLADWGVYLWAVQNGRVLECSLGYYIQPIVVFILGAVIFREKVSWRHIVILAVVVVGIVLSTDGFNGIPYVTILLAVCFAIYAAIKRSLRIDSVVSTSAEIVMMVPLALLFILFFRMGDTGMGSITPLRQLMLLGAGVVTAMPMVLYSVGVKYLPLMTAGFCQYLSPTLAIVCGMVMGEYLTAEKLRSFYFIWAGVLLYCLNTVYEERKKSRLKP
ncbi:transporter [Vescimonas fastidiosa]|uniref:Transporter n=1 Tax=Vescimonas fastidiosa TaxID=2714353 RepID=A0A810PMT5_9FIRM|nr:EamA family transporter RarD [Vescimonas fastidiosa]BCK78229.1 transporter [Vescimonas fastidiosa]